MDTQADHLTTFRSLRPPAGRSVLFDPAELDDMRGDDPALYERLLTLFVEESAGRLARLRRALSSEDWVGAGEVTHSIKGSSATVGAVRMASAAKSVEALIRVQDAAASEAAAQLERVYEDTRELLAGPDGPLSITR